MLTTYSPLLSPGLSHKCSEVVEGVGITSEAHLLPRVYGVSPSCQLRSHLRLSAEHVYVASVHSLGCPTAWRLRSPRKTQEEATQTLLI